MLRCGRFSYDAAEQTAYDVARKRRRERERTGVAQSVYLRSGEVYRGYVKYRFARSVYDGCASSYPSVRTVGDEYVFEQGNREFGKDYKFDLVGLLNKRVRLDREYSLHDAIGVYVKNVTDSLDRGRSDTLLLYKFE